MVSSYGMRWGLPFHPAWTYGDSLFIVDPWIWLVLGAAVFLASSPSVAGLTSWALMSAWNQGFSLPSSLSGLKRVLKTGLSVSLIKFMGRTPII